MPALVLSIVELSFVDFDYGKSVSVVRNVTAIDNFSTLVEYEIFIAEIKIPHSKRSSLTQHCTMLILTDCSAISYFKTANDPIFIHII